MILIIITIIIMWSLYEIIHIWTAVVDESEEWSSQLIFQFKQLERRSLKKKKKGFFVYNLSNIFISWECQFVAGTSIQTEHIFWTGKLKT